MQKILLIGLVLVSLLSVFYFWSNPQDSKDEYLLKIQKERKEKDDLFKNGKSSPLVEADKKDFKGLNYFEVDSRYKVKARLEYFTTDSTEIFPTTGGKKRYYKRFGKAFFKIDGLDLSLTLWLVAEKNLGRKPLIFLPFTDLTSDEESYGAGRYLDLEVPQNQEIEIDFNKAYNPYCVYNEEYNCPLVPRENYLPIKIKSGEKKYK